jgi:hypothetical protein
MSNSKLQSTEFMHLDLPRAVTSKCSEHQSQLYVCNLEATEADLTHLIWRCGLSNW